MTAQTRFDAESQRFVRCVAGIGHIKPYVGCILATGLEYVTSDGSEVIRIGFVDIYRPFGTVRTPDGIAQSTGILFAVLTRDAYQVISIEEHVNGSVIGIYIVSQGTVLILGILFEYD